MPRWAMVRVLAVAALLATCLITIVARAYRLCVLRHDEFAALADEQTLAQVRLPGHRGSILDRHGRVLAVSVDVDSVWANPRAVGSKAGVVARELAKILGLRANAVEKKLRERRFFSWIKRRVSVDEAQRIHAAALPGVYTQKENRRFYPQGQLAANLLGFVGIDSMGLEGIEHAFEGLLRGTVDETPALRDALGQEIFPAGLPDSAARKGHDLTVTLDQRIQHLAEQAIREAVLTHRAKAGWVVVTDPQTGEILAIAQAPSFDPNHPENATAETKRNRAIADLFEPGSTAKVFSFAAALEAGIVQESERFYCENGKYHVGGHNIRDAHPEGWLELGQVLAKSSNIGTAKIAQRLGRQRLYDMLARLGFGHKTGVEFLGEPSGMLHAPSRWSEVGLANVSFGQGFAVTSVQLAQALGAIANGGILQPPRLVRSVTSPHGQTREAPTEKPRRVVSADVARRLTSLLVQATEKGGTGTRAAIPGYPVAGKTGTAQKIDSIGGGYSDDRWIAAFMGFVPAQNPQLLAVVVVDEPQGELHYGGLIAAPVFSAIAGPALKYLGVPAEEHTTVAAATATLAPAPSPPPAQPVVSAPTPGPSVPDFTGMGLLEAIKAAQTAGLAVELIGTGRAVGQNPGPGDPYPYLGPAPGPGLSPNPDPSPRPSPPRVRIQFEPG